MIERRRPLVLLGLGAASVLLLTGCGAGGDDGPTDSANGGAGDRIAVVASTNVYGQIAEQIGGDLVDVTSIVTNDAQDPHSFEPTARDQLTISSADLIIENGGGYDSFIDALIESSGSQASVITAVQLSHDWPENDGHDSESHDSESHDSDAGHDDHTHDHVAGFNEHVWYDPDAMAHLADDIAAELTALNPEHSATFAANAEEFSAAIGGVEDSLAAIYASHGGAEVFVTEPVPAYLIRAAGLENVTPGSFSEAVEEGQDVPPAALLESLGLLEGGAVRVVVTNTQTGGAETTRIVEAAEDLSIPIIAFSETLPKDQTYISWMQGNIEALTEALDA